MVPQEQHSFAFSCRVPALFARIDVLCRIWLPLLAFAAVTLIGSCGQSKPTADDYIGNWTGTVESITGHEGQCHLSIKKIGQSLVIKSERQKIGNCLAYEGIWTLTPEGNLKGGSTGTMIISYDRTTSQAVVSGLGQLRYLTKAPSVEEITREGYWVDGNGLTWTTHDNGQGKVDLDTATAYCRGLRLGGWSDWRLPSIEELESVYDRSSPKNNLSAHERPAILPPLTLSQGGQWVWSSTTFEANQDGQKVLAARTFHFVLGQRDRIAADDVRYSDARVLCVRR